jgi:hypothetical protein
MTQNIVIGGGVVIEGGVLIRSGDFVQDFATEDGLDLFITEDGNNFIEE